MRAPSKPDAKPERRQKEDEQNEQSDSSIAQGNDAQSWEIDTGARLRLIPPPGPQDALHLGHDRGTVCLRKVNQQAEQLSCSVKAHVNCPWALVLPPCNETPPDDTEI